jgi:hypothetical protein
MQTLAGKQTDKPADRDELRKRHKGRYGETSGGTRFGPPVAQKPVV